MNARNTVLHAVLGASAVLLLAEPRALAQLVQPNAPPSRGAVPPGLVCTAEAANVSAFVGSDGSVAIYNVPSGASLIARATCSNQLGQTKTGHSPFVTPIPGGTAYFASFDFGTTVPLAAQLTLSPSSPRLIGLGSSTQLVVGATFADQSTGDVTAGATGTTYRSSNPSVATVSADGLVTAVGGGSTLVYALHEGTGGLATVNVLPAALASLSAVPSSLGFALSPTFPVQPAQLRVTGSLTDASTIDWTPAASGVVYQSSNPNVAVVGVDGSVLARSPGFATISVVDVPSGIATQVPVTVTTSSPTPFNACQTAGFANNVDVEGVWAFVAAGTAGLQILDANDCTPGGVLPLPGQNAVDVRVRGALAAVALGPGGLALVDVADVSAPHLRSITTSIGDVRDLWISGDRVYAASSSGLFVYDAAGPGAPVLVGSQAFGSPARAVAADATRGLVVVLTAQPALEVIQMNGGAPWPSAAVALPPAVNQADDVTLLGTSAYVANGRAGIHEIDVTNPAAPLLKASSTLNFDALGVAAQRTPQGTFVAGADDLFVNAVPLFDARLNNTLNIDFSSFPGVIQADANSNGIALGDGFGVVSVGGAGIQVFRTRPLSDNAGRPPVVSIASPNDGGTLFLNTTAVIRATASDDVGVAFVSFFVDGSLIATDASPPFTAVLSLKTAGQMMLTATATDFGGNVADALSVHVDVVDAPVESGCADGQREGFVDMVNYPHIAGCSGAWTIKGVMKDNPGTAPACPGLPTFDTVTPACGRNSGDDSPNKLGTGCNVADLCAVGWHVCTGAADVTAHSLSGCKGATQQGDPPLFFISRQSSNGCNVCATGQSTDPSCNSGTCVGGCLQTASLSNDVYGCGTMGSSLVGNASCAPLDRGAGGLPFPWSMSDPSPADDNGFCEAYVVLKSDPSSGGALCCRNP